MALILKKNLDKQLRITYNTQPKGDPQMDLGKQ